jgi:hypothetical protein
MRSFHKPVHGAQEVCFLPYKGSRYRDSKCNSRSPGGPDVELLLQRTNLFRIRLHVVIPFALACEHVRMPSQKRKGPEGEHCNRYESNENQSADYPAQDSKHVSVWLWGWTCSRQRSSEDQNGPKANTCIWSKSHDFPHP